MPVVDHENSEFKKRREEGTARPTRRFRYASLQGACGAAIFRRSGADPCKIPALGYFRLLGRKVELSRGTIA